MDHLVQLGETIHRKIALILVISIILINLAIDEFRDIPDIFHIKNLPDLKPVVIVVIDTLRLRQKGKLVPVILLLRRFDEI